LALFVKKELICIALSTDVDERRHSHKAVNAQSKPLSGGLCLFISKHRGILTEIQTKVKKKRQKKIRN